MRAGISAIAAFAAVGCADATVSEEQAIEARINENIARENACDFSGAGDFYAPGGTVYLPNFLEPQPLMSAEGEGRESELCDAGGRVALAVDIKDIDLLNDGAAIAHGVGTYAEIDPDGKTSLDGEFSFVYVFVKDDGGWKMRHSHIAQIVPYYPTVPPRE